MSWLALIRLRSLLAAIWLIAIPAPAFAQLSPFSLIAQYESGDNPAARNPNSTASGLFGFINSTWQTDLAAIGGNVAEYPSAYLAPASLQFAVAAYDLQNNGFADWTCAGCDPALTAALAADGGPAAFNLANLSIDPASYTELDAGGALAAYFQANGGAAPAGGGADFAGGDVGAGGDVLMQAPPANAVASPSALSFEWVYGQVINGIMGQVDSSIQTVEGLVSGPATTILALAIAIMGMMTMMGNMDMAVFLSFAIRAAVVMAFIQVGNTFYNQWVENLVLAVPTYFSNAFSASGGIGATPAQLFDQILNGWFASILSVWHSSGWSMHAIFVGVVLALLTMLIVLPSLAAMFTVFLISTFLLLVMLTIGPLMILALLFQVTRRFFHSYVSVMVTGAVFALVVDIVLGIFSSILTGIMANFAPSGSPDTDLPGLFGLAAAMLVTGFSMARLPRLIEAIGGGVAVSLDTVGRYMAGGFAAEASGAAAAIATRVV
jgi:type IV secretion system protein VirB6